ncbi:unnamed protein product [Trichogramma brassicae]|uniref:Peptidase A2 domain-containing protein n=1 Tax=Trichogramma brassicae TaxID=86971 RepID=A0A6H5HWY4_9HYME|nr:unnamed protein product [Trichogramma brassicae]
MRSARRLWQRATRPGDPSRRRTRSRSRSLQSSVEQLSSSPTITRESVGSGSGHRGRPLQESWDPVRENQIAYASETTRGLDTAGTTATHGDVVADNCKPGCTHPLTKNTPHLSRETRAAGSEFGAHCQQHACRKADSTLYVIDRGNDIRFLVDSGSAPRQSRPSCWQAANATLIATFGEKRLTLNIGVRRPLEWTFIIADVSTAILGADFIIRHDLLRSISLVAACSTAWTKRRSVVLGRARCPRLHAVSACNSENQRGACRIALTRGWPRNSLRRKCRPERWPAYPDLPVQHHIVTAGQPVFTRPRRLAGERLEAAKSEFANLLERRIIRPLFKASGRARCTSCRSLEAVGVVTGDYRLLNTRTRPDRHPLPIIEDLLQEIGGDVFLGWVDL